MKKLTCHCENVELEVNIPEAGFPKLMRCNCSLCKRKGAVMSPLPKENVKLVKGQDSLKLYQYHLGTPHTDQANKELLHVYSKPQPTKDQLI